MHWKISISISLFIVISLFHPLSWGISTSDHLYAHYSIKYHFVLNLMMSQRAEAFINNANMSFYRFLNSWAKILPFDAAVTVFFKSSVWIGSRLKRRRVNLDYIQVRAAKYKCNSLYANRSQLKHSKMSRCEHFLSLRLRNIKYCSIVMYFDSTL